MNISYKNVFALLIALSFLCRCTKKADGIIGPTGPAGANGADGKNKASAITGYVNLFDQYGEPDSSNGGVNVSAQSGDSIINAISDITGKFSLPNLPIGSYDLHFKKNGFDSLKVYVTHSGGDEDKFIGIVRLNESLTTSITSEPFSFYNSIFPNDTNLVLQVFINFSGPPTSSFTRRDFNLYFSRSVSVSSQNYDVSVTSIGSSETNNSNQYTISEYLENFINQGFHYAKGDTVYVKTYVVPVGSMWTTWFNYATNQNINYPYFGDSTLNYFTWPQ